METLEWLESELEESFGSFAGLTRDQIAHCDSS